MVETDITRFGSSLNPAGARPFSCVSGVALEPFRRALWLGRCFRAVLPAFFRFLRFACPVFCPRPPSCRPITVRLFRSTECREGDNLTERPSQRGVEAEPPRRPPPQRLLTEQWCGPRAAFAPLGEALKLFRQLPVARSNVGSIGVFSPAALFHRPRSIVVGIVRHEGRNEHRSCWVRVGRFSRPLPLSGSGS